MATRMLLLGVVLVALAFGILQFGAWFDTMLDKATPHGRNWPITRNV